MKENCFWVCKIFCKDFFNSIDVDYILYMCEFKLITNDKNAELNTHYEITY